MPELPEVETIKRDLCPKILGQTIFDIRILDSRIIRGISPQKFRKELINKKFSSLHRRGKALIFEFSPPGEILVVQLMMTGQLVYAKQLSLEKASPNHKGSGSGRSHGPTKLVFILSNGEYLLYNDQRLFGRLQIVRDLKTIKYFEILGPEPLEPSFTVLWLKENLKGIKRPIKNVLLDHTFVAGIGNIYASEILFEAGIDPRRPASQLRPGEVQKLFLAIRFVLRRAIRFRGTSMRNYRDASGQKGNFLDQICVYGRNEERCRRCRKLIQRVVMAGRSTFYCPNCQK